MWNILEGEGRQCAQHRGLWRDPAPSTLLEIQLETNNSGKYRWVILDQGRMLNLLPFISVSLKIKKKTTFDFVTHMDFYMKASQ